MNSDELIKETEYYDLDDEFDRLNLEIAIKEKKIERMERDLEEFKSK